MELKSYQRKVLANLRSYLRHLAVCGDPSTAYNRHLADDGLVAGANGVARYTDDLGGTPKVCVKVPTGGGKTFIAANAVDVICEELAERPSDVVVWLVPRKEILKQTLRQLRDPANPLRMALDRDFAHRVEVLDKEDGLRGRGFTRATVEDQLTVFVLSYDSFKNKDGRRAFAENSALMQLTDYQRSTGQAHDVEGADDTALISALAGTNPIVVVDESHHAKSSLSVEMLRNLNPRFVLELTATPRKGSNVISRVTARELKDEQMVKLPVIVYRRCGKREVVQDAILLQKKLEMVAADAEAKGGGYIRPIALLQAESKGPEDAETYEKLKQKLVDAGIPAEQIAIRVSGKDELGDADLMSRACPIRYVITVEALSEGWDCPFAYILATVANRTSKVSVEQIVGRVLRQPYAHRSEARSLNISYVLTSSEDFNDTIDQVIEGLNGAGFSKRDVVESETTPVSGSAAKPEQQVIDYSQAAPDVLDDDFELTFPEGGWDAPVAPEPSEGQAVPMATAGIEQIIDDAEKSEAEFEQAARDEGVHAGASSTGLVEDVNENRIRVSVADGVEGLRLPVFRAHRSAGLFSTEESLPFERGMLLEGFDLKACATTGIAIDAVGYDDARQVDIDAESNELKVRELVKQQADELRGLFASYSDQSKKEAVRGGLVNLMSTQFMKAYGSRGLSDFVGRVVDQMTPEQVDAYLDNGGRYARAIASAIDRQAHEFAKKQFDKMVNSDDIVLERTYSLPPSMAVRNPTTKYGRTLYEAECGDMNGLELRMADALSNAERVLWWHRVDERKKEAEFCINGFINHYPDFIAMTVDGALLAIETKGEQLKNDDSRDKLELGGTWALMAGKGFRYCMVFDHDAIADKNSYTFDEFRADVLNKGN